MTASDHPTPPLGAYLAGDLPADERALVENHLVDCDACWQEVQLARDGAAAAALAAETCPPELRLRIDGMLADALAREGRRPRPVDHRWIVGGVAASAVVALTVTGAYLATRPTPDGQRPSGVVTGPVAAGPTPFEEAVACYRLQMLPGSPSPAPSGPDLARVGLTMTGATSSLLAGQSVTALAYGAADGESLFVFLSDAPLRGSSAGATTVDGYAVFTDLDHPMVVVGSDAALVRQAAEALARS